MHPHTVLALAIVLVAATLPTQAPGRSLSITYATNENGIRGGTTTAVLTLANATFATGATIEAAAEDIVRAFSPVALAVAGAAQPAGWTDAVLPALLADPAGAVSLLSPTGIAVAIPQIVALELVWDESVQVLLPDSVLSPPSGGPIMSADTGTIQADGSCVLEHVLPKGVLAREADVRDGRLAFNVSVVGMRLVNEASFTVAAPTTAALVRSTLASAPARGWDAIVRPTLEAAAPTTIVRVSDTVFTVKVPASPQYSVDNLQFESISVSLDASLISLTIPASCSGTLLIYNDLYNVTADEPGDAMAVPGAEFIPDKIAGVTGWLFLVLALLLCCCLCICCSRIVACCKKSDKARVGPIYHPDATHPQPTPRAPPSPTRHYAAADAPYMPPPPAAPLAAYDPPSDSPVSPNVPTLSDPPQHHADHASAPPPAAPPAPVRTQARPPRTRATQPSTRADAAVAAPRLARTINVVQPSETRRDLLSPSPSESTLRAAGDADPPSPAKLSRSLTMAPTYRGRVGGWGS